uniref:Gfo/Idh/MocA family oxidoreductase n=1 Tax=Prevotella sp. GTC17260 TaxID=3236796 RepID=A0AB33JD46_9BACT
MKMNFQPLSTPVPNRKSGQRDVLQLATEPLDKVRIGFVGLGYRGQSAVNRWQHIDGVEVVALCDTDIDFVNRCASTVRHGDVSLFSGPDGYTRLCALPHLDIVYICTDWQSHAEIALCAMEHGKHVAIEVPAALSLAEIWQLVDKAETSRRHCMMLENSVYDYFESAVLQLYRCGAFGNIVHVEGGYAHTMTDQWTPWRMEYNRTHRGDVYPTHGLGPLCQLLDIHRADRLDYLVAMQSDAYTGNTAYQDIMGKPCEDFSNGDETTTLIRTLRGKTITLTHNVMNPRPYSRGYKVVGTQGYASKYPQPQLLLAAEGLRKLQLPLEHAGQVLPDDVADRLLSAHYPSYFCEQQALAHELDPRGGMSFFMDYRLAYCLQRGLPLDMDVYDMAEWCCVSELSALSIAHGAAPVCVPDFTRGAASV